MMFLIGTDVNFKPLKPKIVIFGQLNEERIGTHLLYYPQQVHAASLSNSNYISQACTRILRRLPEALVSCYVLRIT